MSAPAAEHVDVLIVGAGISGIGAAYHLQDKCPGKSWLILEARGRIGGTWDLFRYPGVRSDSDMYTLGFPFRPWRSDQAIVGGEKIREYVEETAREFGIDRDIRFDHKVIRASWTSRKALWEVEAQVDGVSRTYSCSFLYLCSGYYDYEQGYRPDWPGEEAFEGRIVHPQSWPDQFDYAGKNVVVIGSGATAVTLVPAMARQAAQVTMLQRSPSYIVSRPSRDLLARWVQRLVPRRAADSLVRWKNVLMSIFFYDRSRKHPVKVRKWILRQVEKELPAGYPLEPDFAPSYDPWDQRLCLVPDGDLFAAIRSGKASIVTDEVQGFTKRGLRLKSGKELAADIVVTATGLVMKLAGGITLKVDGKPVNLPDLMIYKGMMLSDVPNLAIAFGYTNASWTLRSDLTSRMVTRLLAHMDFHGYSIAVPRLRKSMERRPVIDFSSGYVRRAEAILPKQGTEPPWRVYQNYIRDRAEMRSRPIADDGLELR